MRICLISMILVLTAFLGAGNALACDTCGCSDKPEHAAMALDTTIPDSHPVDLIDGLNIELVNVPDTRCAYMEGTILGDMDKLFGEVMAAAGAQGLYTADLMIGSMYPDDMSKGIDESTRVFCGLTIAPGADVTEPLLAGTIEAGMYLRVEHIGDYALLEDTYTKIFTWAFENGVSFTPPTFEVYLTNPETTPVEEWLTHIYIPFDHEAMKEAFKSEMSGHGHEGHGHEGHDHSGH